MREREHYLAGGYLRLSEDDRRQDGNDWSESSSIRTQRTLILAYLKQQKDIELSDFYIDDGYTGTDFQRPGFCRLMRDIEVGKINCIIVKDLSRLGRDYIEAGRLIQKTFPAFHVRFISVNDQFDSLTADSNTRNLVVPIKNFVNDSYSRDLSQKIKSARRIRQMQGRFLGASASYGYRKKRVDGGQLEVDPYAAAIVRRIYHWKIEGRSNPSIAAKLNRMGVRSPADYKRGTDRSAGAWKFSSHTQWSATAIRRILENELYIGMMVQGKTEKPVWRERRVKTKPQEEWIRVANTHPQIVTEMEYRAVQQLRKNVAKPMEGEDISPLFSGILFCGDCGAKMVRRNARTKGQRKAFYICSTKHRGEGCSRHAVYEDKLKTAVFAALAWIAQTGINTEQIPVPEPDFNELSLFQQEWKNCCMEQNELWQLQKKLFEDVREERLEKDLYQQLSAACEKQLAYQADVIAKQERVLQTLLYNGVRQNSNLEQNTVFMLRFLVRRILVFEQKHVTMELYGRKNDAV